MTPAVTATATATGTVTHHDAGEDESVREDAEMDERLQQQEDEHDLQSDANADADAEPGHEGVEEEDDDDAEEDGDDDVDGVDKVNRLSSTSPSSSPPASSSSSVGPLKRPMSAYFHFLADQRTKLMAELAEKEESEESQSANTHEGKSNSNSNSVHVSGKGWSVAVIGKILGERWKQMSETKKEPYVLLASREKEAYDRAIAANPSLKPSKRVSQHDSSSSSGVGGDVSVSGVGHEVVLPLSRVKKIMDLDQNKRKISKEAVTCVEQATQQFLSWLSVRCHLHATSARRRGLRAQDLDHVIRTNDRLEFLRRPMRKQLDHMTQQERMESQTRAARMEEMRKKRARKEENEEEAAGKAHGDNDGGDDEQLGSDAQCDDADRPSPAKRPATTSRRIDSMFQRA